MWNKGLTILLINLLSTDWIVFVFVFVFFFAYCGFKKNLFNKPFSLFNFVEVDYTELTRCLLLQSLSHRTNEVGILSQNDFATILLKSDFCSCGRSAPHK